MPLPNDTAAWLKELAEIDVAELARVRSLDGLSFGDCTKTLAALRRVAQIITQLSWDDCAEVTTERLTATARMAHEVVNQIRSFRGSAHDENVVRGRIELVKRLGTTYSSLAEIIVPKIIMDDIACTVLQKAEAHIAAIVSSLQGNAGNALQAVIKTKEEIAELAESVRSAAGIVVVGTHTKVFVTAADDNARSSRMWLAATIIAMLTMLAAASLLAWRLQLGSSLSDPTTISRLVAKALVISTLFSAMMWCARTSRSYRHLAEVNRHRAHALQTYEALAGAAQGDPASRNLILLEASRSIFSSAATGFLAGDTDHSSDRLLEVTKTVAGRE